MDIRRSVESERSQLLDIHRLAFGHDEGSVVAQLVNDLLDDHSAKPILSLVAVEDGRPVGHVLFTHAVIASKARSIPAQILAPLAVLPNEQNKGIGEKLINEGLRILEDSGTRFVFVLGHPTYYPRFGFIPAGAQGFEAPYLIPVEHAEAWMVLALKGNAMNTKAGKVQCSKTLDEPRYWFGEEIDHSVD